MPMEKVLFMVSMDSFTKDNGEMIFNMEKVLRSGPKVSSLKESLRKEWRMEKVDISLCLEIIT